MEFILVRPNGDGHQDLLDPVEQPAAVPRPARRLAALRGDLPSVARTPKRPNIDLVCSRFI